MNSLKDFAEEFDKDEVLRRLDGIKLEEYSDEMPKIAVLGISNSGKSSLINHLFGENLASVSVRSNETKEVGEYIWGDKTLIDLPGHSAQQDTHKLVEYAVSADIVIYLLNSTQGIMDEDIVAVELLRQNNVPLIFGLSRIDMLGDTKEDIDAAVAELLDDAAGKLPLYTQDVIVPISVKKGINIEKLVSEIAKQLSAAQALSFARRLRDFTFKDKVANTLVWKYSIASGAVGVAPLPLSDIYILTPLQVNMIRKIGDIYGYKMDKKAIKEFIATVAAGQLFRMAARNLLILIPGYGWAVAGAIAFGGTYALGKVSQTYFKTGMSKNAGELIALFKDILPQGQKLGKEHKDEIESIKDAILSKKGKDISPEQVVVELEENIDKGKLDD